MDKLKELILENLVLAAFALVTLLIVVVWQAIPSAVWQRLSDATPKSALWALLALSGIAITVLIAFLIDYRRKGRTVEPTEPRHLRMYGLFWDDDLNPLCPADSTMLTYSRRHSDGYDILRCAQCGKLFLIHDPHGANLTIAEARDRIRTEMLSA